MPDRFWIFTGAALLLGAVLRLWGPLLGQPAWHPDEFNFVYWPLLFFEGDLNPDVFYYPHLLYYVLALIYGACIAATGLGSGLALEQLVALHYFWRGGGHSRPRGPRAPRAYCPALFSLPPRPISLWISIASAKISAPSPNTPLRAAAISDLPCGTTSTSRCGTISAGSAEV